jgi:HNH endonuclease
MPVAVALTKCRVALVDAEDSERVAAHSWRYCPNGYADASVGGRRVYLHRFLTRPPAEAEVDHIDGDRLNNTRANLRLATRSANARNRRKQRTARGKAPSSRHVGVTWRALRGVWEATIRAGGRQLHLGHFTDEGEAADAYRRARAELENGHVV